MDIAKGDHDIGLSPSSALPAGTSREGPQDDSTAFLGGADLESVTAAGSSADRGLIELSRGGQIEELVIPMGEQSSESRKFACPVKAVTFSVGSVVAEVYHHGFCPRVPCLT